MSFSPMFHWTDNNIRVHAFYCVLALTVARLMRPRSRQRRHGHERPRTARHPRRHPRNRAPLPIQRRPAQSTTNAHRNRPHPTPSRRALQPRPLRPRPMTTATLPVAWDALEAALRQRLPSPRRLSRSPTHRLPARPRMAQRQSACSSATRPAATPRPAALAAAPEQPVAEPLHRRDRRTSPPRTPASWQTADNYNPAHPFNAIDEAHHRHHPNRSEHPSWVIRGDTRESPDDLRKRNLTAG